MPDPRPAPTEAVAAMNIHAPTERNPKLARFLEAANANTARKRRSHPLERSFEALRPKP